MDNTVENTLLTINGIIPYMIIQSDMLKTSQLESPAVAVDTIILTKGNKGLEVVLIKIKPEPYKDKWAVPGSLVRLEESLDDAAKRIIKERVSNDKIHMEQIYAFGDVNRDIRGRSISVAYFALLNDKSEIKTKLTEIYSDIGWYPVNKLPKMAFDHKEMIKVARNKLSAMADMTETLKPLLPEKFTLSELKTVYEMVKGNKVDRRNFIKKVKAEGKLKATNQYKKGLSRPAKLYSFKQG